MGSTRKTRRQPANELDVLRPKVAELKKVEGALLQSQREFAALFEGTVDGKVIIDAETMRVVLANQNALDMFGFSSLDEALDANPLDYVHPEDREQALQAIAEDMFVRDLREVKEFRTLTRDGRVVWVSGFGTRILYQGRLAGLVSFTDIADRKYAEDTLRQSEAYFHSLIDNALDVFVVLNDDGTIRYESSSIEELSGFRPEERQGRSMLDLVHPDDMAKANAAFTRMIDGQATTAHLELRLGHKDGSYREVEAVGQDLRDDPAVAGIVATMRDVSDRRQAERALRESERNFRTLADNSLDCITVLAGNGTHVYANQRVAELTGYSVAELRETPFEELVHPDHRDKVAERYRARTKGKSIPSRYETVIVRKDGTSVPIEVAAARTDWRRESAVMVIYRDITERKQAEEELRASETRYRLLAENASDIIWTVDMQLRPTYISPSIKGLLGYTVEEAMGKTLHEVMTPATVDAAVNLFAENLAKAELGERPLSLTPALEGEVHHRDGHTIPIETSFTLLPGSEGQPGGILGVTRDITQRKQAEEELRLKENAIENSLNAVAMSDMAGNVTYVNQACMRLWGGDDKEDLLGKPYRVLSRSKQSAEKMSAAMLETGAWAGEVVGKSKDGTEIDLQVLSAVLKDTEGNPVQTISTFVDITERKKAEQELKRSEERFRAFIENAPDAIVVVDAGGIIRYQSPAVGRLLGYGPDELVGKEGVSLADTGDIPKGTEVLAHVMENPSIPISTEVRVQRKDGSMLTVEATAQNLIDNPVVGGIVVNARDVTERKAAEEALLESEEHYSALVGNLTDAVFLVRGGVVAWCNDRVEEIYGYPVEELLGRDVGFFYPRDMSHSDYTKLVAASIKQLGLFRGTDEFHKKDGTVAHIEYSLSQIPGSEPIEVIAVARDVTEQKRAEEALRKSESEFRSVLENSTDVIYRLSLGSGTYDYMSPSSRDLFGYSPEECTELGLLGMGALVHPDDMQVLMRDFESLAARVFGVRYDDVPATSEYRFNNKELGYRWLSDTRSVVFDQRNEPVAVVGTVRDVTERKEAEEALRDHSERLEEMVQQRTSELTDAQEQLVRKERLAVLGQLAGGVGHELRNPLGAMKNATYFLNMAVEQPDPEVKETLEIIEREVGTCERIIDSLLEFARQRSPTRRKVNINHIVEGALSGISRPEEVKVDCRLDEKLPLILADPDQLIRVFGNVILNAFQAMTEGGELTVESEAASPGWVTVSFADTGGGITAETPEKVFEPLYSTKAKGIGLGLAVSRTWVEGHGGVIDVQSEIGKGTTFRVRLPISEAYVDRQLSEEKHRKR